MAAVGLQHHHEPEQQLLILLNDIKRRNKESCCNSNQDNKIDIDSNINDLKNGYESYDVVSANYVIFALDLILKMRRALHRRQSSMINSIGQNSHPNQFTLRIGVYIILYDISDAIFRQVNYFVIIFRLSTCFKSKIDQVTTVKKFKILIVLKFETDLTQSILGLRQ